MQAQPNKASDPITLEIIRHAVLAIPNHIDVNVENMKIGESVHVSDLTLPAGVTAITEGDTTIVVVSAPRAVIEEAAAPTAEGAEVAPAAEPEVIRAKKTEEETEEK